MIANIKRPLGVKMGECGLRQSDALFLHTKNLPDLCAELSLTLDENEVLGVGVSSRPRSVEGSYMPCFLAGVSAANAFVAPLQVPLYEFSHQDGHVMAALWSSGGMDSLLGKPFLVFHVSGGTTELLLARPDREPFSLQMVGNTSDLNAGQVIDRVGVMLGIDFPCGAALETLARDYEGKLQKLRISVSARDMIECNLSGVENKARRLYEELNDKNAVAAFVFDFICRTLIKMCECAIERYGDMPVLFAGGVMSNMLMRKTLSERFDAYFAEPRFSADNAAGIALLARHKFTE